MMKLVFHNPVLECSTINGYLSDMKVSDFGKDVWSNIDSGFVFEDEPIQIQWFNNQCSWIKIRDVFIDQGRIPFPLYLEIETFMRNQYNYEYICCEQVIAIHMACINCGNHRCT